MYVQTESNKSYNLKIKQNLKLSFVSTFTEIPFLFVLKKVEKRSLLYPACLHELTACTLNQ